MTFFRPPPRAVEQRDIYGGGATYNPMENPAVPLASVALDSVFSLGRTTGNSSGEVVSIDTAICLPTVLRCVSLLATVVAGCPLKVYKDPGKKVIKGTILDRGNGNSTYTQYELWELTMFHLCLWGNAFVLKVRNGGEQIVDLKPINPALVQPKIDPASGHKIFLIKHLNPDGSINTAAAPALFSDYEIMHIPGAGYDGLQGFSPIGLAQQSLGTAMAGDKLAGRFYSSGTQLGGIIKIKNPLASQTQADAIKARWMQKNSGLAHAGNVVVLDAESDWQPVTIPPDALQFLESRRWQTTEIARLFGIPPHLVGDVEKSTSWGTGIEEQNTGFIAFTVSGYTNRIEQRTEREVINTRGQFCEFDYARLLRGDMLERFQAYALGVQWGWITRADCRDYENLEPIDGLDQPLTPLNMAYNDVTGTVPPTQGLTPKSPPGVQKTPGV